MLPAGFIYASEEAEPEVIGDDSDPDLCVLVDPLDTSELAVRALHGYTHVLVYSRSLRQPVAAVVGDIYHHVQLYLAARHDDGTNRASLVTRDGDAHPLRCDASVTELSQSLVTNYLMRPAERFRPLAGQDGFLDALASPAPEFAKGFAIWDLAPGHYILHAAGGTILTLDGERLPLDHGLTTLADIAKAMAPRQKFIAAVTPRLARQILSTLHT